ncbi:Armadillo repeat-containing protein 6 [Coccomyxa sp. Obi]|nr:Armadillo repeat-containing protein 6 [Coccomyxa sp. Obi]
MVARKYVTQDSFDAAVQENINEFDMTPDEAVKSAVEEFEMQGADLSGIIRSTAGGNIDSHPVALAVQRLAAAVQAATSAAGAADEIEAEAGACQELLQVLQSATKEARAEAVPVAIKAGAVRELLRSHAVSREAETASRACLALSVLPILLNTDDAREDFSTANGVETLADALDRWAGQHSGSGDVIGAAAAAIEAAAAKHEGNKCAFVDAGVHARLIAAAVTATPGTPAGGSGVGDPCPPLPAPALAAICSALRSFATADDLRPSTSRAFQNGRTIANAGALEAMFGILQRENSTAAAAGHPELVAAVCGAMRRIAVNDEICTEFADLGGLAATMQAVRKGMGSAAVSRSGFGLLRQLANSDAIKNAIVDRDGLELINSAVVAHIGSSGPLEQALGLLASLMLRNPGVAERAAAAGCIDTVLDAMRAAEAAGPRGFPDSATGAQWVQRQACMALRNMVARSPELRPAVLERGAEAFLRRAKVAHPATCADVGSAALRDLGFDDYLT